MAEMSPVELLRAAVALLREGPLDVWGELVDPALAEPLAAWLDAQAKDLALHVAAWTHPNAAPGGAMFGIAADDPARLARLTDDHSGRALRVARVLLGVPDGR